MNAAGEGVSKSSGTWVPQLFFDLIARVIPGAFAIGLFALSMAGPERSWTVIRWWLTTAGSSQPSKTVLFTIGFVLSYVMAIVLWGIWHLLASWTRQCRGVTHVDSETGVANPHQDFAFLYECIKRRDPSVGSRITKLKAEIHMTNVLMLAGILSLGIDVWKLVHSFDVARIMMAVVLVVGVAGVASAKRHFVERTDWVIGNAAMLLGCDEEFRRRAGRAEPQSDGRPRPVP